MTFTICKVDGRSEDGVDMECSRQGENEKILISVKKKPQQKDVAQLEKFDGKIAITRIYLYIGER
jgi:hypothetical protein